MKTQIIETERLMLRPLKTEDAEEIFQSWATDPEVGRFMRWNLHDSIGVTRAWLAEEEASVMDDDSYNWGFVLKENGKLIGCGGLVFSQKHEMFEIGYNLARDYWGNGYVTEAAKRIVEFARENLDVSQLFATHAVDNAASGRVLEKIGFIYQNEGMYSSFDGSRNFRSKEYRLDLK